ncbi:hypothetical protein N9L06_04590 [Mariniblastus sp.]|nr:hypothetical protein [Mariniblastus sp.]
MFFFAECVMVVGILSLIAMTVHATRRYTVPASPSDLSVVRKRIFGLRLQKFDRKQIRDIGVESSGLQVNARLYWHLAIHATDQAKAFTLMSGRDEREIAYVAALIRQVMGFKENSPVA